MRNYKEDLVNLVNDMNLLLNDDKIYSKKVGQFSADFKKDGDKEHFFLFFKDGNKSCCIIRKEISLNEGESVNDAYKDVYYDVIKCAFITDDGLVYEESAGLPVHCISFYGRFNLRLIKQSYNILTKSFPHSIIPTLYFR